MRRRAFTLIEMLAATVLAALLMVAVLSAVRSTAAAQRMLQQRQREADDHSGVVDLLEWDLRHLRDIKATGNTLAIESYNGLDPETRAATHRPVEIRYVVEKFAGRKWLVRRQLELTEKRGAPVWSEPLCPNIESFSVAGVTHNMSKGAAQRQDQVPRCVELTINAAGRTAPITRQIVIR